MKGNFPNLVKEIDMQVQEAERVPQRHVLIKMLKAKRIKEMRGGLEEWERR